MKILSLFIPDMRLRVYSLYLFSWQSFCLNFQWPRNVLFVRKSVSFMFLQFLFCKIFLCLESGLCLFRVKIWKVYVLNEVWSLIFISYCCVWKRLCHAPWNLELISYSVFRISYTISNIELLVLLAIYKTNFLPPILPFLNSDVFSVLSNSEFNLRFQFLSFDQNAFFKIFKYFEIHS